jgi:Dolichyl-phosphate-mannose-protein mannosyltransferase
VKVETDFKLVGEVVGSPSQTTFGPVKGIFARWSSTPFVFLALVCTAATRVVYLLSNRATFNADEATTGIMVTRILQGHFYAFYAGQSYGGAIEQYIEAGFFYLSHLPQNPFTLRLTLVLLSTITCALTYGAASRLVGPKPAAFVAILFAVTPWYNIVGSSTSLGFYDAAQCLSIACVYFAARIATSPKKTIGCHLLFGLCIGLAIWTSITTLYVVVPVAIWMAPRLVRQTRTFAVTFVAICVGSCPEWITLLRTGRLPVPKRPERHTDALLHLGNLFGQVGREYFGLTYSYAQGGLPVWIGTVIELGIIALYLRAVWNRRRHIYRVVTLREDPDLLNALLFVPVLVTVLYALSTSTWFVGAPRYLFSTYPVFMVGIAALCKDVAWSRSKKTVAVIATAGLLALTIGYFGKIQSPTLSEQNAVYEQAVQALVHRHDTNVVATYWTGMPLQYAAGSALNVGVYSGADRFKSTQRQVYSHRVLTFVGSTVDGSSGQILRALHRHHIGFDLTKIGFLRIYDHLDRHLGPKAIGL